MDRNLGASQVATSSTDSLARGDLYQWGRFSDGHQCRTSGTTTTTTSSNTPGHGNFILYTPPIDSEYDWRMPHNDNLWQGVGGVNNPCPTGYRLPTSVELNAERASWGGAQNTAGAFASPLKLPAAGWRHWSTGVAGGTRGYYWSSTVSGTYSSYLFFKSDDAIMDSEKRMSGFSVRCIKQ